MIKSFKVGDVLSESSHYIVLADNGNLNFKLKHLESGDMVYIGKEYIHNCLERVLRGFKIQFESRDGRHDCIDMDIEDANNVRPVNINTIKWIILGGTKYVVE